MPQFDKNGWCWDLSQAPKDADNLKVLVTAPFFGTLTPRILIGTYTCELNCELNEEEEYKWYLGDDKSRHIYENEQVLAWGYVEPPIYENMPESTKEKLSALVRDNIPPNFCDNIEDEYQERLEKTMNGFR